MSGGMIVGIAGRQLPSKVRIVCISAVAKQWSTDNQLTLSLNRLSWSLDCTFTLFLSYACSDVDCESDITHLWFTSLAQCSSRSDACL